MRQDNINSAEFERFVGIISREIQTVKDDLLSRIDKLEDSQMGLMRDYNVGATELRGARVEIDATRQRLDRQDKWRLATIAPGLVAMAVLLLEWIKGK